MAETDIIISKKFAPFIDRTNSIQPITDIFSKTQQNEWKKRMEPEHEMHHPWMEQTAESNIEWTMDAWDSYTGHSNSGKMGPTAYNKGVACQAINL